MHAPFTIDKPVTIDKHEILLIDNNTASTGIGSHWLLGLISFSEKCVIMFDSLDGIMSAFDPSLWRCIFSADTPKQPNMYVCGFYVTITACCTVAQEKENYVKLESSKGRRWMHSKINMKHQPVVARQISGNSLFLQGKFQALFLQGRFQ